MLPPFQKLLFELEALDVSEMATSIASSSLSSSPHNTQKKHTIDYFVENWREPVTPKVSVLHLCDLKSCSVTCS